MNKWHDLQYIDAHRIYQECKQHYLMYARIEGRLLDFERSQKCKIYDKMIKAYNKMKKIQKSLDFRS